MNRYQITSIILYTYRHEWVSEMLYMRISKQNIAPDEHMPYIYISVTYYEQTMRERGKERDRENSKTLFLQGQGSVQVHSKPNN